MTKINPITLSIEEETWSKFCKLIPDTRTKNGTIVELIEEYVKKRGWYKMTGEVIDGQIFEVFDLNEVMRAKFDLEKYWRWTEQ